MAYRNLEKKRLQQKKDNQKYRLRNLVRLRAYDKKRHTAKRGMGSEQYKRYLYDRALRSRYGLSRERYDALLIAQGGLCAICGTHYCLGLDVDHCHQTGVVRGLLCRNCNRNVAVVETLGQLNAIQAYLNLKRVPIE